MNSADLTWGATLESQVQWGNKKKARPRGKEKERRGEKRKEVVFLKKIIGKHGKPQD